MQLGFSVHFSYSTGTFLFVFCGVVGLTQSRTSLSSSVLASSGSEQHAYGIFGTFASPERFLNWRRFEEYLHKIVDMYQFNSLLPDSEACVEIASLVGLVGSVARHSSQARAVLGSDQEARSLETFSFHLSLLIFCLKIHAFVCLFPFPARSKEGVVSVPVDVVDVAGMLYPERFEGCCSAGAHTIHR